MYHLIKKNQKKLLAIFAVLLMISFVATFSVGRGGGSGGRADTVVAHLGSNEVYDSDLRAAQNDWNWARRTPVSDPIRGQVPVAIDAIVYGYSGVPRPPSMPRTEEDLQKWSERLRRWERIYGLQYQLGMAIATNFFHAADQHNELLYLLSEEARRDGLDVNPDGDLVNSYLFNALGVQPSEVAQDSAARSAIRRLLLVGAEIERLKDSLKVSQPLWQHEAMDTQSVRLNLIEFRASDYQRNIPAPTTQQVQQQFDRFKDLPPHMSDASNPLGFGYQIPARVKLQYVEIPHAEVLQAVIHTVHPPGSDASAGSGDAQYDWEVQAASYYDAHQDEFQAVPKTQPTTRSVVQTVTTQPTTSVAETQPKPTTQPFAEVKQQIVEKLATAQVETLSKQIAADLAGRLAEDYQSISKADPAAVTPETQPASRPATTNPASTGPAGQLMALSHLEQLREQVQQKYHVAIQLHELAGGWQTQSELEKLPGIGTATTADHTAFANLATSFQYPVSLSNERPLRLWQPSPSLTDGQQNTYLFRLTAAEPPHAPSDMASIATEVASDWKLSQAYEQAMQAAQKALTSAKTVGLSQAARTLGQPTISTPLFPPGRAEEIPGYPLGNPAAEREVARAAADLLTQATPVDRHPDALVALPSVARVAVIELAAAQLPEPEWLMQYSITQQEQMKEVQRLTQEWFTYDRVVARTGYKPEPKS